MRDFILVKSINLQRYNSADRYIIAHNEETNDVISVAKVVPLRAFDENASDFTIVEETSSAEYVVKVLHKNKKGIFYKKYNEKFYLTEEEIKKLNLYINEYFFVSPGTIKHYCYDDIKKP